MKKSMSAKMAPHSSGYNRKKVVQTVRDAVVTVATKTKGLQQKTKEFAQKVEKKWDDSASRRKQATDNLKKAGKTVLDFGKDVQEGFNKGLAEVEKR